MERHEAELITSEYLKSVYGFSLKHCKCIEDAEDLTQEIMLKALRTLLIRDDIYNAEKFIWTIAHNTLCNYYRDNDFAFIGVPVHELENVIPDYKLDIEVDFITKESVERLQSEIAYLSKQQRQIIISYYFENKKQKDIAEELNIPIGTVKWHLFEAKKELKKGMYTVRNYGELKFNPIKFDSIGFIGIVGKEKKALESALSQNIVYSIYLEAKTINQISSELGVSPVYVESEIERLEDYCFVMQTNGKYLSNILIDEPNEKIKKMSNTLYSKAAKLFANDLYDELMRSDVCNNENITGGFYFLDGFDASEKFDNNFFMWALIPYITALSGNLKENICLDDIATHRPDGSFNICHASIIKSVDAFSEKYRDIESFFGPCYHENDSLIMERFDSAWSGKRINLDDNERAFVLLTQYINDAPLSKLEYAFLSEQGYITTVGNVDKLLKISLSCVFVNGIETRDYLFSIGEKIKEKYKNDFEVLRKPLVNEVLKNTPKHLRRTQEYTLQNVFDTSFILSCLNELVSSGKLVLPTEEQKKSLHTIIIKK